MENSGQRYAPVVDRPPEPPLRHHDDEFVEVEIDSIVSEKLALVWRRRRVVRNWVLVCVAIAAVLWFVLPRRYDSTVRLMPPDAATSNSVMNALASGGASAAATPMMGFAATMFGAKTTGDLYVDALSGPRVLDAMIDKFDLRKEYGDRYYEYARKDLLARTIVDTNRKSGVITITVTGNSPQKAQAMAQGYADELDTVIREVSNSGAKRERIFLENRLKVVKAELDESSKQLAAYASKNVALDIPEQAKATLTAAARGQAELIALQAQLEGLRQIYTDNNSRVQALQRQIAELRRQIDVSDPNGAGPGSMLNYIKKLPKLGLEWAELYRTATIDEAVFEALTKQYEFAKVQEAKETTSVQVLDPPTLPERKSSPKGSVLLLVALFISVVGSCSYILAKDVYERMDPVHPAKMYIDETRARWVSRWRNNRLRMRAADRRPESNG